MRIQITATERVPGTYERREVTFAFEVNADSGGHVRPDSALTILYTAQAKTKPLTKTFTVRPSERARLMEFLAAGYGRGREEWDEPKAPGR